MCFKSLTCCTIILAHQTSIVKSARDCFDGCNAAVAGLPGAVQDGEGRDGNISRWGWNDGRDGTALPHSERPSISQT